jgi:phage-related protein
MPSIGDGVKEVRVRADGEYRVFYVAKFEEAVYVLHAFAKKTRRTSKKDIDVAVARFRVLVQQRARER